MGRIRRWYRNAIRWNYVSTHGISMKGTALTLEETDGSIETFRTKFVVSKGAQELGNKDICLLRDVKGSHVTKK